MRPIPLLLVLLLAALAAAPAAAQRTLAVGDTAEGVLERNDAADEDGIRYDIVRFRAREGGTYRVTLHSQDFDPLLRVGGPEGEGCDDCWMEDDDGGGGLDAQVVFAAPATGTYVIHARSYAGGFGRYRLSLEEGGGPSTDSTSTFFPADTAGYYPDEDTVMVPVVSSGAAGACELLLTPADSAADFGTTVALPLLVADELQTGELEPGSSRGENGAWLDEWWYSGRAGETILVDRASDDFDALLSVGRHGDSGWEALAVDDDWGEGTDSRIELTLPRDDLYVIRAGALYEGAAGAYTLYLRSRGPAPAPRFRP